MLATLYQLLNKRAHFRHLSTDCLDLLEKAKNLVETTTATDPCYYIADDKLG